MTEKLVESEKLEVADLSDWFRAGIKPEKDWGIGTEHEQFLLKAGDLTRLRYNSRPGIREILSEGAENGWLPIIEKGNIIALQKDGASITIEPAGQFELSGSKLETVHETYKETIEYTQKLEEMAAGMGFVRLPIGFDPFWRREDLDWMPKERYSYMRAWMPGKGNLGLDMMSRTSSIQVNLDFSSEADMVRKMQVAQAFQPVITALFANSPFTERQPNGYLSYRSHVWDDTDPDRCGFLPFIFDDDFGFERYTQYLLDVPLYFIFRDGVYYPADGMTFRDFMKGKHHFQPRMADWETHVTTVFPDVRLKRYIELRGADSGSPAMIVALAAFWVGLLYDTQALDAAHSLALHLGIDTIKGLRAEVPVKGLKAESNSVVLHELAAKLLSFAQDGLTRRALKCSIEPEQKYLEPLNEIVSTGITSAEKWLNLYNNKWNRDISKLIE
ncbi:MAG TPA: glutamate--cysteine ligase [Marinilabiliaceae bacterium]|nr:glutamate--cysteine ligase [Marinilabiliaceae bacterium]